MRRSSIIISIIITTILGGVIIASDRANIPETTAEIRTLAVRTSLQAGQTIPPRDFIFDGCTLFPELVFGLNLTSACLKHDIAYWSGGTEADKQKADLIFKDMIANAGKAGKIIAPLAYFGVYLFGDTWLSKIFDANWGFGWNT